MTADGLRRYPGATHAGRLAARARMIDDEHKALARRREEREPFGMERFRRILRSNSEKR